MRKWRFDKRGWVVKAVCTPRNGKIYADAESATRERSERWLAESDWQTERIDEVDLVFEEGLLWPVGSSTIT
jgi:hypothetical protein